MRCGIHLFGSAARSTVDAEYGTFGEATPRPNPWPHS